MKRLYTYQINVCVIKEEDKLHVFDRNGMYLATKKIGKNNPKAAEIEADNMERVRWNQAVDRALISGVAEEDILDVKREKISKEVKRSIELYGNNPSFLVGIIRLAIKALELLISKALLAVAKVAERVVDNVYEKVVEKVVSMPKDEPKLAAEVQEKVQLPKKPIEPLLLSKYPAITKLDVELKRRNEEIFVIEQERSNLEIELSECTGVFKKKQRKELQERISLLDKKAEKMKSELSRVLRDADMLMLRNSLRNSLRCVRRSGSMKRLVRNGRMNALGRRLVLLERHSVMRKQQGEVKRDIVKCGWCYYISW